MKETNMRFAFAVNQSNNFELKHFGDADKYLIYEFMNGEFKLILEEINNTKSIIEEANHGSKEKGNSIIRLLRDHKVSILVSRQFGKNIKMVNQYFIPIVIYNDNLLDVLSVLTKNMKWIVDELNNNKNGYKLFSINKGILKSNIK
jgi:predicted Fe-Mo cluster-binding NifX family protein